MTDDAARREKPFAVLGLALGLLVILAIFVAPLVGGARRLDGDGLLAEHFEAGPLPFGFAVTRAVALPDGRRIVLLSDPDAPPKELPDDGAQPATVEEAGTADAEEPEGQDEEEDEEDDEKWARLEEGEPGLPPNSIALVNYPKARADDVLRMQFGELEYKDLTHLDDEGETVPVDSGGLDWGAYRANYVRLRHFELERGEPTFHDTLRVNLTLGERCWVAFLRWDPFAPGDTDAAEALLAALLPL